MNTRASEKKKQWLDYVNRLHERERAKLSLSGLSIWVLLTAFGTVSYKIYQHLSDIRSEFKACIILVAFLYNLYSYVYDILNSTIRREKVRMYDSAVKGSIGYKQRMIWEKVEVFYAIICILLNGSVVYYYIFEKPTLVIIGYIPLIALNLKALKCRLYKDESIDKLVSKHLLFKNGGTAFVLACQFGIILEDMITTKDILKYGVAFLLLIAISVIVSSRVLKMIRISWIEDFEEEIISNNLSGSEIERRIGEFYFRSGRIDDLF